jgi:hypothetical protein
MSLQVININDNLKSMLSELYESDCIFDKFETSVNATGDRIVTGCYGYVILFVNKYYEDCSHNLPVDILFFSNQFSVWNKDGTKERSIHLKGIMPHCNIQYTLICHPHTLFLAVSAMMQMVYIYACTSKAKKVSHKMLTLTKR